MMQALRSYLLPLTAAGFLTALCMSLLPKGNVRRVLGLACALLLALTAIRPIAELDGRTLAQAAARLRMQAEAARTGVEVKNRELTAAIIKQSAETYILDKASSMGLTVEAEVDLSEDAAYPYPAAVTLTGTASETEKQRLQELIAETLAIPEEKIIWKKSSGPE